MIAAALSGGGDITSGVVAVVQTFGDDLGPYPHVQALLSRGGWERDGQWTPVPFVDGEAAAMATRPRGTSWSSLPGL